MFRHISQILKAKQLMQPELKAAIISLLPEGEVHGNSYVALNPTRADKSLGSFRIDLLTGKWIDFACGDSGGDIVSLYAYVMSISQEQSARYLLNNFADKTAMSHEVCRQIFSKPPKPPKPPKLKDSRGFATSKVSLKFSKVRESAKIINFNQTNALNFALKIWNESVIAENSPVSEYLVSRGFTGKIPKTIRYHPKLYHSITKSYHPTMVSVINSDLNNEIIGIHRTYLSNDGKSKAAISPNKMILGRACGGAVRLAGVGTKLVITEGIETALSIYQANSLAVWAALSASGMQNIIPPSSDVTPEIIIAADTDEAGMRASERFSCRLLSEGYKVEIAMPPYKGFDFNDLLLKGEIDDNC